MEEPKIIEGKLFADDRGYLSFVNDFNFPGIKRFYIVENHTQGFVRAWHGHQKEAKYMYALHGDFLIGAVPIGEPKFVYENIKKVVLSSKKPELFYIPAGYYNGFMNIQKDAKLLIFSTSTLEESKNDDIRLPWSDWMIWTLEQFR